MGELLGMLALAGLAIFIVWESFSSRRLSREKVGTGFTPARAAMQTALLLLAGAMVYFGIEEWMQPSHPPFDGRRAAVMNALYAAFGPRGLPLLSWAGAAVCICAFIASRTRQ